MHHRCMSCLIGESSQLLCVPLCLTAPVSTPLAERSAAARRLLSSRRLRAHSYTSDVYSCLSAPFCTACLHECSSRRCAGGAIALHLHSRLAAPSQLICCSLARCSRAVQLTLSSPFAWIHTLIASIHANSLVPVEQLQYSLLRHCGLSLRCDEGLHLQAELLPQEAGSVRELQLTHSLAFGEGERWAATVAQLSELRVHCCYHTLAPRIKTSSPQHARYRSCTR